jgi:SpoVK/Ycf46/Vps4 family AAA+-type ATPase
MSNPILRALTGAADPRIVESVVPQRRLDDVILSPATRRSLEQALVHITQHDLVFNRWGLKERHPTGLALAFNFAGPPGTGKTMCAEAIAHELGARLLIVRYAHVESMWMGETAKNVVAAFRQARKENAVLLFDEADAIASRRSSSLDQSFVREANTVVSVLLQELERFSGVVIFATNLAANLDPAFERRIRTHVLFEMPGIVEREQIWRVQVHPSRTPLRTTSISARWPSDARSAAGTSGTRCSRPHSPPRRSQATMRSRRFTSSILRKAFGRSSPESG